MFTHHGILLCVIASLCLSVGEGLRLRPFPVSSPGQFETTNGQLIFNAATPDALKRYGPVDLPARAQNRGKRQLVEFGNPLVEDCRELIADQVLLRDDGKNVSVVSVLLRLTSTGRAPPAFS